MGCSRVGEINHLITNYHNVVVMATIKKSPTVKVEGLGVLKKFTVRQDA
jgi:hypothetical protein